MKKLLFLFIGSILISGCEEQSALPRPEQLMNEKLYTDIFYELEMLRVYQVRGTSSKIIDSLYIEIFKKYDADTTIFRKSHEFYQTQLDEQQARADSVISMIKTELAKFDSVKVQDGELRE